MADEFKIQFEGFSNLVDIYETLLEDGVEPGEMDTGWETLDGRTGAKDGEIHERELLGYLYDNWQKYQELLEQKTKYTVPWTLDDKDPSTDFDEKMREYISALIDDSRKCILDLGAEPDTPIFRMRLALEIFQRAIDDPKLLKDIARSENKIDTAGGIATISINVDSERTALETLRDKKGQCTEMSKVLFTIYSMAGLNTRAVLVDINDKGILIDHIAVQVEIYDGSWITVDPYSSSFDDKNIAEIPLPNIGFAAVHYNNLIANDISSQLFSLNETVVNAIDHLIHGNHKEGYKLLDKRYSHPDDHRAEVYYLASLKQSESAAYKTKLKAHLKKDPDLFGKIAAELHGLPTYLEDLKDFSDVDSFRSEIEMDLKGCSYLFGMIPTTSLGYTGALTTLAVLEDIAKSTEEKKIFLHLAIRQNFKWGRFYEATYYMDQLLEIEPSESNYESLAHLASLMGMHDTSIEYSKRWLELYGSNSDAYTLLAKGYRAQGKHEELLELMDELDEKGMITNDFLAHAIWSIASVHGAEEAISIADSSMKKGVKIDAGLKFMLNLAAGNADAAESSLATAFDTNTRWLGEILLMVAHDNHAATQDIIAKHLTDKRTPILFERLLTLGVFLPNRVYRWIEQRSMFLNEIKSYIEDDGLISCDDVVKMLSIPDEHANTMPLTIGLVRNELDISPQFAALWEESAIEYFKKRVGFKVDKSYPNAVTVWVADEYSMETFHYAALLTSYEYSKQSCKLGDEGCQF